MEATLLAQVRDALLANQVFHTPIALRRKGGELPQWDEYEYDAIRRTRETLYALNSGGGEKGPSYVELMQTRNTLSLFNEIRFEALREILALATDLPPGALSKIQAIAAAATANPPHLHK